MNNLSSIQPELVILTKLIIAHFAADFVFQTRKMSENKTWFSLYLIIHTAIVFTTSALFSFEIWPSLFIAILHYLIDGTKSVLSANAKFTNKKSQLFLFDQLIHLITILAIWAFWFDKLHPVYSDLHWVLNNVYVLVIAIGYFIITLPTGYFIGLATSKLNQSLTAGTNNSTDNSGMMIGIFERIIIFTFVLLEQYEAIGFLITGKSLLRFASHDESKKSEYVLLGTMLSYSITIVVGVIVLLILKAS